MRALIDWIEKWWPVPVFAFLAALLIMLLVAVAISPAPHHTSRCVTLTVEANQNATTFDCQEVSR